MEKEELKALAQKYLDGEASLEEQQLLNSWYDTTEEGWVEHVYTRVPETEDDVKQRILGTLRENMYAEEKGGPTNDWRKYRGLTIVRSTAAVAAVLCIVFFGWLHFAKPVDEPGAAQVSVSADKTMELTLPDGSKVWLHAGSVFKYPKKFDEKNRTVTLLDGRAFFEVVHRVKHPFIVKTNRLNVVVLGTSFDVRAYRKEKVTKVSVVTGKVGITLKDKKQQPAVMLLPKQQVVLAELKHTLIKAKAPEVAVNAWCNSKLVFEQETLGNVFQVLEKKYKVRITAEDPALLEERISITLGDQHLDNVMNILSFTKHFQYEKNNDSIKISR